MWLTSRKLCDMSQDYFMAGVAENSRKQLKASGLENPESQNSIQRFT